MHHNRTLTEDMSIDFISTRSSQNFHLTFLSQGIHVGQTCTTPASHREVLASTLGADTGYPVRGFLWLSSVPPGNTVIVL